MKTKVGVLALQGAFREHRRALESLGCEVAEIRKPSDLQGVQGLVFPGGESTTMGKLLQNEGLADQIKALAAQDMPMFGTCAGMILLAKAIDESDQYRLNLMDITVKRNAFGRQIASFETELNIPALGTEPVHAVFIRAPYVQEVAPNVGILAEHQGKIVFVRQGNMIASAFHPELTLDKRVHQYFLNIISEYQ